MNHRQSNNISANQNTTIKPKNNQHPIGFQYPTDQDDTLYYIWQTYKKTIHIQIPNILYQKRCKAISLMIQCHKFMKLPIQTLFLAVSVFDKVLNINYQLKRNQLDQQLNLHVLSITCLYSCQKLQKIRNYGVNHWLKHLSSQNLLAIGYQHLILTSDRLKKYQAYVMKTMNYNLLSSTPFDILMAVWTLKPPSQKQFYFAQYLLELSLFCQFNTNKLQIPNKFHNIDTATSINQITQNQQNQNKDVVYIVDIVLSIINLTSHFFPKETFNQQKLIKTIWGQYKNQQNRKSYYNKYFLHKNFSNQLFQKILNAQNDIYCRKIVQKYRKHTNLSISKLKYVENKKKQNNSIHNENGIRLITDSQKYNSNIYTPVLSHRSSYKSL